MHGRRRFFAIHGRERHAAEWGGCFSLHAHHRLGPFVRTTLVMASACIRRCGSEAVLLRSVYGAGAVLHIAIPGGTRNAHGMIAVLLDVFDDLLARQSFLARIVRGGQTVLLGPVDGTAAALDISSP